MREYIERMRIFYDLFSISVIKFRHKIMFNNIPFRFFKRIWIMHRKDDKINMNTSAKMILSGVNVIRKKEIPFFIYGSNQDEIIKLLVDYEKYLEKIRVMEK